MLFFFPWIRLCNGLCISYLFIFYSWLYFCFDLFSFHFHGIIDGSDPMSYSGKIIECSWRSEERVWVCMRIRTDKGTPNDFNTYKKVMRSIKDNITEEILLGEINETIKLPMYADRIQKDSKPHHHINSARRRWLVSGRQDGVSY